MAPRSLYPCRRYKTDTAKLSWLRKLRKHEPAGRIELHCAMVASRSNQMFHAVVDTNGLPVRLELSAGEAHDYQLALKLLSRLRSGSMLLADRGYDADWIRAFVTKRVLGPTFRPDAIEESRSASANTLYRAQSLVERFLNMIKHCRRVATRYHVPQRDAGNENHYAAAVNRRLFLVTHQTIILDGRPRGLNSKGRIDVR
jgi:transposase